MNGKNKNDVAFDLLYPDEISKKKLTQRRAELQNLPQDYLNDLEIRDTAQLICPENPVFLMDMMKEMCCDTNVINYRLDAMEDLIACPKVIPAFYKLVRTLLNDECMNAKHFSSPDTFTVFRANVASLNTFTAAVDDIYIICGLYKDKVKSAAVKGMFDYFTNMYESDNFNSLKTILADLKDVLEKRVRSVTVAINFDDDMRPFSAGIVNISDTAVTKKPNVLDRLLYPTAKRPDDFFAGKIHDRYIEDSDIPHDIDKNLFIEIENMTKAYMNRLTNAFDYFDRIGFDNVRQLQMQLDFYSGAIRLKEAVEARGLSMCRPEILSPEKRCLEIKGVYDLCYYRMAAKVNSQKNGDDFIVTNDINFDNDGYFYILTGANNGGKTTFTRAVGLCQIMSQLGIFVPATYCRASAVDFIYTHFPKEEVVGINSSRFTTEIKELKTISDTITSESMLLMNESIQSTTPKECISIAKEILRIFTIIGTRGIYATHLIDLAYELEDIGNDPDNKSKLVSITVCVDENTKQRLYKIKKGVPAQTGYADTIFKQFGIDIDKVRVKAKKSVNV